MALRDHSLELNAPEQCKAALQGESMRKPQADFGYMYTLLEDFFKRSNIRSALRVIADQTHYRLGGLVSGRIRTLLGRA
jgi:hypothetical protein